MDHPQIWQTVLDCVEARPLAESYRQLLGLIYRPGDEPPAKGPDLRADVWLVLRHPDGRRAVAFQPVPEMPVVTWPDSASADDRHPPHLSALGTASECGGYRSWPVGRLGDRVRSHDIVLAGALTCEPCRS